MRKNSEEKPIDIISMNGRIPEEKTSSKATGDGLGGLERKICQCIETGRYLLCLRANHFCHHGHSRKGGRTEQIRKERQVQEWWLQPNLSKDLKRAVNRSVKR